MTSWRLGWIALYVGASLSCGPTLPSEYVRHADAARIAYSRGDYESAASEWAQAKRYAPRRKYVAEARYRQATSLKRAGKLKEAQRILTQLSHEGRSDRAARATFDVAYLELAQGKRSRGLTQLRHAIERFPNSGLAGNAVRQVLGAHIKARGPDSALALLNSWILKLGEHEVGEVLRYEKAKLLETTSPVMALVAYQDVVQAHPYPFGALWDEAMLKQAELQLRLGRPRQAQATLHRMLSYREAADFLGSYERHFSHAQFRLAELHEAPLAELVQARREFRRVHREYKTSTLRDDALWRASVISHRLGHNKAACEDATILRQQLSHSRFNACLHHVCVDLAAQGVCRGYILRQLKPRRTKF